MILKVSERLRQCKYDVKFRSVARHRCWNGKSINITYSECKFVALGMRHAMRMRRTVICGLSVSSILSHKRHDFRKKVIVFRFSLQIWSEIYLILRRTEWDMIKNVHWYSCDVTLFFLEFNETWIFLTNKKDTYVSNFMKIRLVRAEFFLRRDRRTDGQTDLQTDMMEVIVAFRSFSDAPEKQHPRSSRMIFIVVNQHYWPKCSRTVGLLIDGQRNNLANEFAAGGSKH